MAASDYVPIFFKNRLHLAGRPQMGFGAVAQKMSSRTKLDSCTWRLALSLDLDGCECNDAQRAA
jgi:hypothetical protein